jgi:diguanylate cyclase (GGDEF)-like protein
LIAPDPAAQAAADAAPPGAADVPFLDRLRACIGQRRADGRSLALLLVDCGVIGQIDAQWGYHVGDAVRTRIVSSLRAEVLRPDDFAGEPGRDDVACVLTEVEGPQLALLAAQKLLRTLNAPMFMGEEEIYVSPAVGIALFPGSADDAEALLRQAKRACVTARGQRDRIALYAQEQDAGGTRLVEESRLRTAIAEDALELTFQPQFDLRFGQIMGIEAKLRWRDGKRDMVRMRDAVAAAEAAGMVTKLISSLLNRALRNCSEFRQRAGLDLRIAINFPARVLLEPELAELVERALRTWSLRPGRLVLEIEDFAELQSQPQVRAAIQRLHEIGVKLSIDDTRAPLASLFWLATLPFHELKIDLSLAPDWSLEARAESVLRALVELAHQLKLDVIVVGAADAAAAARLQGLGCDFMQADFRGPAVDAEDFVARYAD